MPNQCATILIPYAHTSTLPTKLSALAFIPYTTMVNINVERMPVAFNVKVITNTANVTRTILSIRVKLFICLLHLFDTPTITKDVIVCQYKC